MFRLCFSQSSTMSKLLYSKLKTSTVYVTHKILCNPNIPKTSQNVITVRNMTLGRPGRPKIRNTKEPVTGQYEPRLDLDLDIDVSKHIKVYSNSGSLFYTGIILAGILQVSLWTQLGYFSFFYLHDEPSLEPEKGWKATWLYKNKIKISISMICLFLGYSFMLVAFAVASRSIKQLWLLKGGEIVRFVTYSPISLGQYNKKIIDIPLKHISFMRARSEDAQTIPVKLKGYKYYFLLDKKKGTFHNPKLYDYSIGLKRVFASK